MKMKNTTSSVIHLAEVDSTNIYLRRLIDEGKAQDGCIVWADYQNAGRGQMGTHWESASGVNLTFSVACFPKDLPISQQFVISEIGALAVRDALMHYASDITVKWPNDVYWRDCKISGTLIEVGVTDTQLNYTISGIGININQKSFAGDAPNPVSLYQIIHKETDCQEVLLRFIDALDGYRAQLERGEIEALHQAYFASLYRREGFHPYQDQTGRFEAAIDSVEPDGHLHLRLYDGTLRRYAFKEVSYVIEKKS